MWDWFRTNKRIEWLIGGLAAIIWLAAAIPMMIRFGGPPYSGLAVLLTGITGFTLTICLPAYLYLRLQRAASEARDAGRLTRAQIPGHYVWGILMAIALVLAALRLPATLRPFGLTTPKLIVCDVGVVAIIVGAVELLNRYKKSRN